MKGNIYNLHLFLIILSLCVIIVFLFILLLRLTKKLNRKKNLNIKDLSDWSSILIPLQEKISILEEDKQTVKKELFDLKEEVELYSSYILNFINGGVLVVNNDFQTIYKNNWFKEHTFVVSEYIKNSIDSKQTQIEYEENQNYYLISISYQKNIVVMIISDIKEIKDLQQQIIQQEKLAYLGKMSSSIAHEFKNSLMALKGFSTALIKKSNNSDFVTQIANDINDEINYFHGILQDYLNYAKEINLNCDYFLLDELIFEIIEKNFKDYFAKISVNFRNFEFFADRDRLKQVFINIIKNGIEANGEIVINNQITTDYIIIEISDNGIGIEKEIIKDIFNPFFTTKETGTGLGLAICHNIILAHKGKIIVKSEKGKGTTFLLYFLKKSIENDD